MAQFSDIGGPFLVIWGMVRVHGFQCLCRHSKEAGGLKQWNAFLCHPGRSSMAQGVPRNSGKSSGLSHLTPTPVRILDRAPFEVTHIFNLAVEAFPAAQVAQDFAAQSYRRRTLLCVLHQSRL
jgi:hypothetical protein